MHVYSLRIVGLVLPRDFVVVASSLSVQPYKHARATFCVPCIPTFSNLSRTSHNRHSHTVNQSNVRRTRSLSLQLVRPYTSFVLITSHSLTSCYSVSILIICYLAKLSRSALVVCLSALRFCSLHSCESTRYGFLGGVLQPRLQCHCQSYSQSAYRVLYCDVIPLYSVPYKYVKATCLELGSLERHYYSSQPLRVCFVYEDCVLVEIRV